MSERTKRIEDFDAFREKAKEIFTSYARSDRSHKRLDELFSLRICPGSRYGGQNKKVIEIFYGTRPIGSITEINQNLQTITKIERANGATLGYFRTDDGHVTCNLYPAKSENERPVEETILLDYVKEPSSLEKKSASHWKMFISYMETTCIDGNPTFSQRLRVFYLKNFKEYVIDGILQETRLRKLFKEVLKYVLTIGLSGFLILVFTLIKEKIGNKQSESRYQEMKQLSKETINRLSIISDQMKNTNQLLQELSEKNKRSNGAKNKGVNQTSHHNKKEENLVNTGK